METDHNHHLIEVRVVYPSAHHPAEGEFSRETTVRQIKQFAMDTFGLKEETVEGNQVVFFLYHDRKKIENLDQPLSTFVDEHEKKVVFRLAKEIIAG